MSRFITIKQAAELLSVCTKTIKRWEQAGKITSQRTIGNHRRFDAEKLQAQALQQNKEKP